MFEKGIDYSRLLISTSRQRSISRIYITLTQIVESYKKKVFTNGKTY